MRAGSSSDAPPRDRRGPLRGPGAGVRRTPAKCLFADSSFLRFSPGLGGQLGGQGAVGAAPPRHPQTRPGSRRGRPRKPRPENTLPLPPTASVWWRRPQSQAGESSGETAAQKAAGRSPWGKCRVGAHGPEPRAPGKGRPGGLRLQPRAPGKALPRRPRAAAQSPGEGPPRRPRATAPRPL